MAGGREIFELLTTITTAYFACTNETLEVAVLDNFVARARRGEIAFEVARSRSSDAEPGTGGGGAESPGRKPLQKRGSKMLLTLDQSEYLIPSPLLGRRSSRFSARTAEQLTQTAKVARGGTVRRDAPVVRRQTADSSLAAAAPAACAEEVEDLYDNQESFEGDRDGEYFNAPGTPGEEAAALAAYEAEAEGLGADNGDLTAQERAKMDRMLADLGASSSEEDEAELETAEA